jgi:hypothetical protein
MERGKQEWHNEDKAVVGAGFFPAKKTPSAYDVLG